MNTDDDILESLIVGGLLGAALGALVSKDKNEGGSIGALAGAVLLATLKANQNAQKTNIPIYMEENGIIYEVNSKGEKKFIKEIASSNKQIPERFKLI